jgi:hypothetical protein
MQNLVEAPGMLLGLDIGKMGSEDCQAAERQLVAFFIRRTIKENRNNVRKSRSRDVIRASCEEYHTVAMMGGVQLVGRELLIEAHEKLTRASRDINQRFRVFVELRQRLSEVEHVCEQTSTVCSQWSQACHVWKSWKEDDELVYDRIASPRAYSKLSRLLPSYTG